MRVGIVPRRLAAIGAALLWLVSAQVVAVTPRRLAAAGPLPEETSTCCKSLSAINFKSELPVIIIDTNGHNVTTKGEDVDVAWCICNMGQKAYKNQNGTATANVHGNSSAKFKKKYESDGVCV